VSEHATAPVDTPADVDREFQTIHRYPDDRRYRKSGMSPPQPGDIAFCGWVKRNPPTGLPLGTCNCLMCLRLSELGR
jgi:hypothetical protein